MNAPSDSIFQIYPFLYLYMTRYDKQFVDSFLDLLIKAFVGLLTAWFVLVTPYVIFQDFVMKGHGYSFATLLEGHYDVLFRTDNWNYVKVKVELFDIFLFRL